MDRGFNILIHRIIISEAIQELIALNPVEKFEQMIVSNVRKELDYIIFNSTIYDSTAFLLLFISIKESADFQKTIIQKNIKHFYYKVILVCPAADQSIPTLDDENFFGFRNNRITAQEYIFLVKSSFKTMHFEYMAALKERAEIDELADIQNDQNDLIAIGKALSVEKDQDKLLSLILFFSQKITGADAGSIFLIEELDSGEKQLRFKYANTHSLDISYKEFTMPLNKDSIAGYVAITGEILNIPDVYHLSADAPVSFNPSFDKANNYRTKSMIVVPMRDYTDQVIGVIQLLNSKETADEELDEILKETHHITLRSKEDFENKVQPFKKKYETILVAIANQAAIAIENNLMMKQIRSQFEEFVRASVTAIESRDPATSGHSFRVADICTRLARAINMEKSGVFASLEFSKTEMQELEYAALLHDFGKVYIDMSIFSKAKKLFPRDLEYLLLKLEYLYKYTELFYTQSEIHLAVAEANPQELEKIYNQKIANLQKIQNIKARIMELNEPHIQENDPSAVLKEIEADLKAFDCTDIDGNKIELLTQSEKSNLAIKRGSLNQDERIEIESHVIRSYNFVSKIPWPKEFRHIPEFTQKHHEMLDGSGYPAHLQSKENIPVQARMITIADIFDSFTAADRPYKKALPVDETLVSMQKEAVKNKIDKDLLDVFIKYKIWETD